MKRILLSVAVIGAVAAIVVGATTAYFSDTETSQGNTFTAGTLDLKVDNTCYYNGQICPEPPDGIETTWSESDLVPGVHKFFYLTDVKPGDKGEDTVSLHVYNNDAWGRLTIGNLVNNDVSCTEPEDLDDEPQTQGCGTDPGAGELRQNLSFWVWLDQGMTPGFQGENDREEGDNIHQPEYEPMLITPGQIDEGGEIWRLADGLAAAYQRYQCSEAQPDDRCKGLTQDGHMVGSVTYYFGVGWELPSDVGNIVQSDTFGGDMTIEVVQYRNNPNPWQQ